MRFTPEISPCERRWQAYPPSECAPRHRGFGNIVSALHHESVDVKRKHHPVHPGEPGCRSVDTGTCPSSTRRPVRITQQLRPRQVAEVCHGLMHLHGLGIIHGNITPVGKPRERVSTRADARPRPEQHLDFSGWPCMSRRIWDHGNFPLFRLLRLRIRNSSIYGPRMFYLLALRNQRPFERERHLLPCSDFLLGMFLRCNPSPHLTRSHVTIRSSRGRCHTISVHLPRSHCTLVTVVDQPAQRVRVRINWCKTPFGT